MNTDQGWSIMIFHRKDRVGNSSQKLTESIQLARIASNGLLFINTLSAIAMLYLYFAENNEIIFFLSNSCFSLIQSHYSHMGIHNTHTHTHTGIFSHTHIYINSLQAFYNWKGFTLCSIFHNKRGKRR